MTGDSRYGYFLSAEECPPQQLAAQARMAEQPGFEGLCISDHCHPWLDEQGLSGFVWSVIGAIREYADAGFDEVYISQIGGNAEGFFDLYAAEVLPRLRGA